MNFEKQVVTIKTEVISVHTQASISDTEYWDVKAACAVLGRSRRTVVRYIENGYLKASKVEGQNGPEWRIVPFTVSRPKENLEPLHNKITQLEKELQLLRNCQNGGGSIDINLGDFSSKAIRSQDLNPGLLQMVAAFFMISGSKLGLPQKFMTRSE